MIATNDSALARRAASVRNVGYEQSWDGDGWTIGAKGAAAGLNLRLTEVQAAVGLAELPQMAQEFARRKQLGAKLLDALAQLGFIPCALPDGAEPVWQALPVWLPPGRFPEGSDALVREAKALGIPADSPYRTPMNAYPFFADFVRRRQLPDRWIEERFPNFERQSRRLIVFKLPRHVSWPEWERHLHAMRGLLNRHPPSSS
jgi:dTDP-4-amino-4,6-dideoxygalactose transaminase